MKGTVWKGCVSGPWRGGVAGDSLEVCTVSEIRYWTSFEGRELEGDDLERCTVPGKRFRVISGV